ncbi:MAG: proteic killer suppression protein [Candidatus Promineifilaceae bacterium]|jgi:proteic killer suppression protein
MQIASFQNKATENIYSCKPAKGISLKLQRVARRKIRHIEAASVLSDLKSPPGNRLEKLKDHRAGQYSIRVNDRYRIYFEFLDDKAHNVEFVDYHDENRRGR